MMPHQKINGVPDLAILITILRAERSDHEHVRLISIRFQKVDRGRELILARIGIRTGNPFQVMRRIREIELARGTIGISSMILVRGERKWKM
jgi:hypothetical protein